jgi:polysaccharide biosynthesis/export protein
MGIKKNALVSQVHFITAIKLFSILIAGVFIISSCSVSKPTYIFRDVVRDTVIKGFTNTSTELKIQKNDLLNISISSLNPAEDLLFNASSGGTTKSDVAVSGFLVGTDGNIYLHKLGSVIVNGITRKELKLKLETALLPFLKDPIVTVTFANHAVTVMGEVGKSQVVNMPEEKISVIDALALSSNVSAIGTLKNVLVIRETPDTKEFKHLNLEDHSIVTSPWYYLQPRDILVVNPNEDKIYKEQNRTKSQFLLSTIVSSLSIMIIIIDRIIPRK